MGEKPRPAAAREEGYPAATAARDAAVVGESWAGEGWVVGWVAGDEGDLLVPLSSSSASPFSATHMFAY